MSITIAKSLADQKPTSRKNTRRAVAGLAAGLALGLFVGATQASASDDFRASFESELGRITAHHVASVGSLLLFGFPTVHHVCREYGHRPDCRCGYASRRYQCEHRIHHARHRRAHMRHSHRHHRHDRNVAHHRRGDRQERYQREHKRERGHREGKKERREDRRLAFRY